MIGDVGERPVEDPCRVHDRAYRAAGGDDLGGGRHRDVIRDVDGRDVCARPGLSARSSDQVETSRVAAPQIRCQPKRRELDRDRRAELARSADHEGLVG